jgi:hypothetical protein
MLGCGDSREVLGPICEDLPVTIDLGLPNPTSIPENILSINHIKFYGTCINPSSCEFNWQNITVTYTPQSPEDADSSKISAIVWATYLPEDGGTVGPVIVESTPSGWSWVSAPDNTYEITFTPESLLNYFEITPTIGNQYDFLIELDAVNCAGTYVVDKKRIGDDGDGPGGSNPNCNCNEPTNYGCRTLDHIQPCGYLKVVWFGS